MVVQSRPRPHSGREPVDPHRLDLAQAAFFLGLHVNAQIVVRGREAGLEGIRESHGYVIQHLIESDRSITELAGRMQVSQQAASKAIAELVELGYVEALASADRRQRRIRLSKRGWEAVRFARRGRRQLEARLRKAVGAERYENARAVILECLDALGGMATIRGRRIPIPR